MAQETRTSFLGAAIRVLEDCQRPMTAREIVEEALRRGWITSAGKTPEATMSAQLYLQVRDDPDGRLVRVAQPGKRGLSEAPCAGRSARLASETGQ